MSPDPDELPGDQENSLRDAVEELEAVAAELELMFVTYTQSTFAWDQ